MKAEVLYRKLLDELQARLVGASTNLSAAQINQPIFLAGLAVGGAWLAERLAKDLELAQFGVINVAFHRDDYAEKGLSAMRSASSMPTYLPFEVNGAHIILIDDVLSTGRTVRAALNELFDFGRPAQVELMVLADRGKRELPIAADFVAEYIDLPEQQILVLEKDATGQFLFQIEERSAAVNAGTKS